MTTGQADVTIVGLGLGTREDRTLRAQRALDQATTLFVRTHGDGVDVTDLLAHDRVVDLAPLRDAKSYPSQPWTLAENAVLDAAASGPVVLAIPGHPRFGEGLVENIVARAAERQFSIDIIDGISAIDVFATALNIDPIRDGVQLFDGRAVSLIGNDAPFTSGTFTATPARPIMLTHVYDEPILAGIHRALSRILPPEHPVVRVEAAGSNDERITTHELADLPTLGGGLLVALYIPSQEQLDATRDPRTLQRIVARLRAPGGCPWDQKQTHLSLRDAIIDEAYEVTDAIDSGDPDNLAEELGDLLLLITMHAQIASEAGTFTIEDVQEAIATKIIGRHPHVFGDDVAESEADLHRIWKDAKARERAIRPAKGGVKDLDGEPRSMPALTRAVRVLRDQPLATGTASSTPEQRADQLLRAVADIVGAGDDPDAVLRVRLIQHATGGLNQARFAKLSADGPGHVSGE